jgi:ketol-acid reductoisomerase
MIDNCSTTARLGARKWAPRFDYNLMQNAIPKIARKEPADEDLLRAFETNDIHGALAKCSELRPAVDIAILA